MIKVYSMTAVLDLSFPSQWTTTATLCIPHDSVWTKCQDHMMESLKMAFFIVILDSKIIFQNDSKICEVQVSDSTHQ